MDSIEASEKFKDELGRSLELVSVMFLCGFTLTTLSREIFGTGCSDDDNSDDTDEPMDGEVEKAPSMLSRLRAQCAAELAGGDAPVFS